MGASVHRVLVFSLAFSSSVAVARLAQAQDDAPLKFNCVVRDAQILPGRTQVRCANKGLNGLSEFAAETTQPYAGRVADAIVLALRTGTPMMVTYAPSVELNPDGCSERNCRKIIDVGGDGRIPTPPPRSAMPPVEPTALPQPAEPPAPDMPAEEPQAEDFDFFDTSTAPVETAVRPAAPILPLFQPMQPIKD